MNIRRFIEIAKKMAEAEATGTTITDATTETGISRKKAERIEDPQGFFKKAKAPFLKK